MKRFFTCFIIALSFLASSAIAQFFSDDRGLSDSASLFLSYESAPERVYMGQIFPIKIKAIIARDDYKRIVTHLTEEQSFMLLNPKSEWTKDSDGEFYTNTFYFQAFKKVSSLPGFIIELVDGDKLIETAELEAKKIEVVKLNYDAKFSNVVAQSLAVKSESTNRFDEKTLIVTLEIEATYSNLRDFRATIGNGSIDEFRDSVTLQFLRYDIIVPSYIQVLEFTYFNTINNDFQLIQVPLNIKSDDVSTHTDLNPKESKFELYKDTALGVLSVLLLALFIWKRYKILLAAALAIVIYLAYTNSTFSVIKIESEAAVRILPAERSSIFYTTESVLEVERLANKNGYVKIMLPNGKIGWVKEEYVIKN